MDYFYLLFRDIYILVYMWDLPLMKRGGQQQQ